MESRSAASLPMTRVTGVPPDAAAALAARMNPFSASTSTAASCASPARPMFREDAAAVVARVFVLGSREEEEQDVEEDVEEEDERGAGEGACFDATRGDTSAGAG